MGGAPVFSVVVPAYNAAATVLATVTSVLAQTRSELEVVVVDDGSTDATAEVVASMADSRVRLVSQPNRGLSAARNAGIAVARGSHVAFLDSDDLWLPDYLKLAARALEATPGAGLAYTDAWAFDPARGRVRRRTAMARMRPPTPPPEDPASFLAELMERNFVWVSTTVPASVLDSVGGFDVSLDAAADYGMWLRIIVAGYRAAWIPGQHGLYRVHAGQMSRDEARMARDVAAVYASLEPDRMPSMAAREQLARRRRDADRALVRLGAPAPRAARRMRRSLGAARRAVGLGEPWYAAPPPSVASAFPDLSAL